MTLDSLVKTYAKVTAYSGRWIIEADIKWMKIMECGNHMDGEVYPSHDNRMTNAGLKVFLIWPNMEEIKRVVDR